MRADELPPAVRELVSRAALAPKDAVRAAIAVSAMGGGISACLVCFGPLAAGRGVCGECAHLKTQMNILWGELAQLLRPGAVYRHPFLAAVCYLHGMDGPAQ